MRIMIFGIPGSGKSTFAVKLSQRLGVPLFHLDKYFFIQGWQERDYDEFLNIQRGLVEKAQWIIDGNATKSLEMRFSRSDIVLYFRFHRLLCLWRIFKRLICKKSPISDRAEGCSENVHLRLLRYLWGFDDRVKKSIEELRRNYPSVQFYELHDDKEARDWIERVSPSQIYLAPYSEQWTIEFEKEKAILLQTIGDWVEDIQHVGSTAVPGLSAKPVIDIMIGVRSLEEADRHCVSRIQNLGYDYIQKYELELPYRRYFQKTSKTGVRTHQIHLVEIDSDWWKRHLLFRDYLRSHPDVAKEYELLKQDLAKKHSDTNEYAHAKTAFIRKIESKARVK
jgi:GrpB-like predicted nucleotidyltransferase (UPF0157 family)/adenylate kinase family enzyme